MGALAAVTGMRQEPADIGVAWDTMHLGDLLAALAERNPAGRAFADQPGREAWSGRPPLPWTWASAREGAGRLAAFLARLGLPPGAPVGICLPNGAEACLAILAVEQAGLSPALLPAAWPEDVILAGIEATGIGALITQARIGDERPADLFCRVAARYFGLRFICAFGPGVPDGVIDLDRILLDDSHGPVPAPGGEMGLITFERRAGSPRPVVRSPGSAIAAAASLLVAAKVAPGERIVSLLAPDDHRGLITGLVAALLSGAALEGHGLFEGASLAASLEEEVPTHLVAPGWMEPHLAAAGLPGRLRSVILVHAAPVRFKARTTLNGPTVDVLALDETALIARARTGGFALTLDEGSRRSGAQDWLRVRREGDGAILVGGPAAAVRDLRGTDPDPPEWRATGYRADLFAGIVIAVEAIDQGG